MSIYFFLLIFTIFFLIIARVNHYADKENWLKPNIPTRFKLNTTYSDPLYFNNKNVIICGLARDIAPAVPYLEQNLTTLTDYFQNHLILIVENDSKDTSRQLLLDMKNKFNMVVLGCGEDKSHCIMNNKKFGHTKEKKRIKKMVDIRNIYMDYINNLEPDIYDYVIMLDFDIVGSVYKESVNSTAYYLNKYPEIDMIGCNAIHNNMVSNLLDIKGYYDSYALKLKSGHRFFNWFDHTKTPSGDISDLIEVDSCFGGFVIYRFDSIYGKTYSYMEDLDGVPICEHVVFNSQLRSKFLNPKMIFGVFVF